MQFRLEADFVFEADELAHAQRRLGAHLLRSSTSETVQMEERSPQGYIVIAPLEAPEPDA